jgi:hypothetical protein
MAPRLGFWVILAGTSPTAFRAKRRDHLLTVLYQLQRTQPDVSLKWFDRGRLWESPAEAIAALKLQRTSRRTRGPGWRPGGAHKDPRERFHKTRDQKRAQWRRRAAGGHARRKGRT